MSSQGCEFQKNTIWKDLEISGIIWVYLGADRGADLGLSGLSDFSGMIWIYLGADRGADLGLSGSIWTYLETSGFIWIYLELCEFIGIYLDVFGEARTHTLHELTPSFAF